MQKKHLNQLTFLFFCDLMMNYRTPHADAQTDTTCVLVRVSVLPAHQAFFVEGLLGSRHLGISVLLTQRLDLRHQVC